MALGLVIIVVCMALLLSVILGIRAELERPMRRLRGSPFPPFPRWPGEARGFTLN